MKSQLMFLSLLVLNLSKPVFPIDPPKGALECGSSFYKEDVLAKKTSVTLKLIGGDEANWVTGAQLGTNDLSVSVYYDHTALGSKTTYYGQLHLEIGEKASKYRTWARSVLTLGQPAYLNTRIAPTIVEGKEVNRVILSCRYNVNAP